MYLSERLELRDGHQAFPLAGGRFELRDASEREESKRRRRVPERTAPAPRWPPGGRFELGDASEREQKRRWRRRACANGSSSEMATRRSPSRAGAAGAAGTSTSSQPLCCSRVNRQRIFKFRPGGSLFRHQHLLPALVLLSHRKSKVFMFNIKAVRELVYTSGEPLWPCANLALKIHTTHHLPKKEKKTGSLFAPVVSASSQRKSFP